MKAGAEKNYKFGTKNNWRRMIWNEIARRVPNRRDAVVLYLAGADDHDRSVAKAKGFRDENLIAVERHPATRDKLRESGVLTIASDFLEAVDAWPTNRPIDVVFGDFCCGLDPKKNMSSIYWQFTCAPHLSNAVFAFNFLRGRDTKFTELRDKWEATEDPPMTDAKHRGKALVVFIHTLLCGRLVEAASETGRGEIDDYVAAIESLSPLRRAAFESLWATYLTEMNTRFFSYQSSAGLVFDSTVFSSVPSLTRQHEGEMVEAWKKDRHTETNKPVRQRISATLAHRTRRLSA